jgi:DUF971 family protein
MFVPNLDCDGRQLVAIKSADDAVSVRAQGDFVAMTLPGETTATDLEVTPDLVSLAMIRSNGGRTALAAEKLRLSCKCAHCTRARFDGRFPETFPGIAIVAVADLGYGLNISFSDGHNRGIYPKSYLTGLADG